ncbi:sensor histidine kinase [Micromonospora zhanjiangensis]|uniref:histidine kinase n=1 Tax=Micromonospora zhanjiangensis TaxID=1522057 RepID=A0ABV8KU72_9ACTN
MQMPSAVPHPIRRARRPTAWQVECTIGTVMMVAAPLTARTPLPTDVRLTAGVGIVGWLVFLVLDHRRPAAAPFVLGGSALVLAQSMAATDDGTIVIMVCVALAALSAHTRPAPVTIVLATVAVLGSAVLGDVVRARPVAHVGGSASIVLVVVMLGLIRRDYRVKAEHAQRLVEREEHARREHARAAALEERTRIARELHDVLAHSLGSLAIQLEVADGLLDERADVAAALHRIRRARRLVDEGLVEARHAVVALREDVRPLAEALARLAADHQDGGTNRVRMAVLGTVRPVAADAAVALLGAAREALTNAARHATGADVGITLEFRPDAVRLTVRNDPAERPRGPEHGPHGYGLTGMAERLALVGGSLTAGRDGDGWLVAVEVPG